MTRTKHRLSARAAMTLASVGRHADGGNLYLSISPNGGRRWVFMYQRDGKQRELGLGPAIGLNRAGIALQVARDKADAARALLLAGNDPIEAKRAARQVPTFGEFADQLLASIAAGFKNKRSLGQWRASLEQDAAPLRALRIDQINTANVLSVLRPIWNTKHETAARLRGRIERVLDAAKAEGLRSGDNPARWRGNLKSLLSKRQRLTRGHLAAIKFKDMPAFMTKLRKRESISARALEFTILTAARTNEVLGASWQEFDLKMRLWTIPAKRMKAGREHVVPLSARAVAILRAMRPEGLERKLDAPVFPGRSIKMPLGHGAMRVVLSNLASATTVHGFRSAFRDWAGDETNTPRDVVEMALAHAIENETEAAYRRGTALAKRRELMAAWDAYLSKR